MSSQQQHQEPEQRPQVSLKNHGVDNKGSSRRGDKPQGSKSDHQRRVSDPSSDSPFLGDHASLKSSKSKSSVPSLTPSAKLRRTIKGRFLLPRLLRRKENNNIKNRRTSVVLSKNNRKRNNGTNNNSLSDDDCLPSIDSSLPLIREEDYHHPDDDDEAGGLPPESITTPYQVMLHDPQLYHADVELTDDATYRTPPSFYHYFAFGSRNRRKQDIDTTSITPYRRSASRTNLLRSNYQRLRQRQRYSRGAMLLRNPSLLLSSLPFFQRMFNWAFDVVDMDGSGQVDEKELYSGLLLIHLKLGTYAGPAACKPISRERCHEVFVEMDVDKSGALDRDEFEHVMMALFGNVLLRVIFQYSLTLLIVPLVAQYLLDCFYHVRQMIIENGYGDGGAGVGDSSSLSSWRSAAVAVSWLVAKFISLLHGTYCYFTPQFIQSTINFFSRASQAIPSSVWSTLDLTLLSTVLGLVVVPWTLMKIDDYVDRFFQLMEAQRRKHEQEEIRMQSIISSQRHFSNRNRSDYKGRANGDGNNEDVNKRSSNSRFIPKIMNGIKKKPK